MAHMLDVHLSEKFLISSNQNPKIKHVQKLWDRRYRDEHKQFIIEGYRELSRAVMSNVNCEMLFICPQLFLGDNEGVLIEKLRANNTAIYQCEEKIFRAISYRDRPDGLIAIAKQQPMSFDTFEKSIRHKKNPFLIVAEAIEKPGNLGTILRSSDAVGVDGLIVCDRCTDIYNPNVVRASVGTLFTVPVVEASSAELILWLKQQHIAIVAATPASNIEYTQVNLRGPTAIIVGAEQYGLTKQWMDQADIKVKISMLGVADSLNVAMATTLLLYETLRQRVQSHE